jgi:hypothetical protein
MRKGLIRTEKIESPSILNVPPFELSTCTTLGDEVEHTSQPLHEKELFSLVPQRDSHDVNRSHFADAQTNQVASVEFQIKNVLSFSLFKILGKTLGNRSL